MAEIAIRKFQEYIRIPSISGDGIHGVYKECADWLRDYIQGVGLACEIFEPIPGKPIVLAKWIGTQPELPSILLNSHYDVVPVMREHWHYDPFGAEILEDGNIVGRGTQDMKCVGIQYVEAIRKLKNGGFKPVRTIILLYLPDEEIGGMEGMGVFLKSDKFKSLGPIGLALDEGLANPDDCYTVFYGERTPWWVLVKAEGPTGHGSRFIQNTAMEKLVRVCDKALEFRREQEKLLNIDSGCKHGDMKKRRLGDVTTINLTMMRGGVTQDNGKTYALNVIPIEAEAGFDIRISPDMKVDEFRKIFDSICAEEGVTWKFAEWTSPLNEHYLTSLNREKNPWWGIFLDSFKKMDIDIEPEIFPAGTDSRFLRQLKIPALGFSPMKNTPILLHEHNEMLHRDVFIEGIDVYYKLFANLFTTAKLPGEITRNTTNIELKRSNKTQAFDHNPPLKKKASYEQCVNNGLHEPKAC